VWCGVYCTADPNVVMVHGRYFLMDFFTTVFHVEAIREDRRIDIHTDRQTHIQTNIHTDIHKYIQTYIQSGRRTDIQADRQTRGSLREYIVRSLLQKRLISIGSWSQFNSTECNISIR
jgi:hypothetical protein